MVALLRIFVHYSALGFTQKTFYVLKFKNTFLCRLKNWDPKELFRDIATPAVVAPMLSPGLSKHIGIYTEGSATRPETLVGALVYRVLDNNVGEFFAVSTAPSHRRRDLATLMLLAMLEDMRAQGCEV